MDYLIKIGIFGFFMTATYTAITYMINFLQGYLVNIPFTPLLCQFGVITGINIYITITITGYLFNRTLSFWK